MRAAADLSLALAMATMAAPAFAGDAAQTNDAQVDGEQANVAPGSDAPVSGDVGDAPIAPAPATPEAAPERKLRSGMAISQSVSDVSFTNRDATWYETLISFYGQTDPDTTLSADIWRLQRENLVDTNFALRLDHRLTPDIGGYVAVSATPYSDFREKWSVRTGADVKLARPITISADLRHAAYNDVEISVVEPGVKLSSGRWSATTKMINLFNSDDDYRNGWSLRMDREGDLLNLFAGGATYPDTEAGVTRRVRAIYGGGAYSVDDHLVVRLSADHEKRVQTYSRTGVNVGLGWRF